VSVEVEAHASSTLRKRSGNVFPRRSARRRIPAHAFGLKKYRSGSGSGSKMSDNETTLAALGHSEELSVQHSPREAIPELAKGPEKAPEGVGAVGQNSGDVFPDEPPRAKRLSQSRKFKREVAALVSESASKPGDAEGLAGCSSDEEVDAAIASSKSICESDERAMIWNLGVARRKKLGGPRGDFGEPRGRPAERLPRDGSSLDARADGAVPHGDTPRTITTA
jgi:hypothetical protein